MTPEDTKRFPALSLLMNGLAKRLEEKQHIEQERAAEAATSSGADAGDHVGPTTAGVRGPEER